MQSRASAVDLAAAVRRAQLSLLASAEARWLMKYRPDQTRVPAGSREGGQWTTESGGDVGRGRGATREGGILNNSENIGSVDISADQTDANPQSTGPFDIEFVGSRTSVTIDYSRALTGISTIDETTKRLSETLSDTMSRFDVVPEWAPPVYGTAVHVHFAAQVKLQGLRGVEVEQSFFDLKPGGYGQSGSIRTDVLLRNDVGDIIAIYDVKTGGAVLTPARVQELRAKTGVGIEIPIIELQVSRGATIKSSHVPLRNIGCVTALLWNPVHRGSVRPGGGT